MTIESSVNDGIVYSGNDITDDFSFPFAVNSASQVEVVLRDSAGIETILTTNFTITGFDTEGSGNVHYPDSGTPLATGDKLAINPTMDYKQGTSIRNQGTFSPVLHEDAFDTAMMHIKELKGLVNRAIKFKKSSEITEVEYTVDPVDNRLLAWDGTDGSIKNVTNADLVGIAVSSFAETYLDDSTAEDTRVTLGAASNALDNLDSVAINTSLISDTDNTDDLGSATKSWKDLYLGDGLYLGGTGAANKLNDYEEGTFTPVLQGSGTAGTPTYNLQDGAYTKIGRLVTGNIRLSITAFGGSPTGDVQIAGLPFIAGTTAVAAISRASQVDFSNAAYSALGVEGAVGGAVLNLWGYGSGTSVSAGKVQASDIGSVFFINLNFSYFV